MRRSCCLARTSSETDWCTIFLFLLVFLSSLVANAEEKDSLIEKSRVFFPHKIEEKSDDQKHQRSLRFLLRRRRSREVLRLEEDVSRVFPQSDQKDVPNTENLQFPHLSIR